LRGRPDVALGLATGSWTDSAQAKLQHAGIDANGLAFASADDCESRVEIMKACERRVAASANATRFSTTTYIGDGLWDTRAAAELGWRFIGIASGEDAVGLQAAGARQVFADFSDIEPVERALFADGPFLADTDS
jgi:phosphoglycolate phosphatase-like HAD superfamily hydrolase